MQVIQAHKISNTCSFQGTKLYSSLYKSLKYVCIVLYYRKTVNRDMGTNTGDK